jgi:hypothetical protein
MSYQNKIVSMSSDLMNSVTTLNVQIVEDMGFATRIKDTIVIRLEQKFTGIGEAQSAVDDFVALHAAELGLVQV